MNTKIYICALAGAVALAGSAFAQTPDMAKVKDDAEAKTPKSFLGVEFGKKIEEIGCQGNAYKTSDGSAVRNYLRNGKKFRKFTDYNRMEVFGSITSHEVFKFTWDSVHHPKEWTKEDAWDEFQKTCDVIAKKFGGKFVEVKVDDDFASTWDKTAECLVGMLKIRVKVSYDIMKLEVTHLGLEKAAKQEFKAAIDAQGDGSDAL